MDQFDLAQELDAHYCDQALAEWRRHRPQGEARTHCLECGKKIPDARREAAEGCLYCVTCGESLGPQRRV